MVGLSQENRNIIKDHPLINLVDRLQSALQEAERIYDRASPKGTRKLQVRRLVHLVIQRPPTEYENVEAWNFDVWKAVFTLIDTIPRSTPPASVPPSFDGTPVKYTSSSQKGSEQTRELVNPLHISRRRELL
ncbi:conserved hypothetical protein [Histoplasma capsulatum var. duboisii H88]|uniref:Uncharacterized protein n=1 Tax=Ajellomyces capsulatus (strain H88) TaxID=544711 RepID=F0UBK5_AJEC8|nr:conserved hypothetical protein [Histoplasma capsulatum var. duboisii H88]